MTGTKPWPCAEYSIQVFYLFFGISLVFPSLSAFLPELSPRNKDWAKKINKNKTSKQSQTEKQIKQKKIRPEAI